MQVSAQGFVNIARRFLQNNALLRHAHGRRFTIASLFAVWTCSGRAEASAKAVPERIAVTAAIAPEPFRS